jgi:hypothetical protein
MALKLLNPGLRPLGMFDLDDEDAGNLVGGEYVELQSMDVDDVEAYAADVGQLSDTDTGVNFVRAARTAGSLGGLADEGVDEYGTLFGSLIGSSAGRATQSGTNGGAVVIGPATSAGSGKVTVWAQAGLYGVNDQNDAALLLLQANAPVQATTTTGLLGGANGSELGIYVGAMTDSSLVSTTNAAVGIASATEFHTVFFSGNAAGTDISI